MKSSVAWGIILILSSTSAVASADSFSRVFRQFPKDVQPLLVREAKLNDRCRDDPDNERACDQRDAVGKQLEKRGWCWGPDATDEADKRWMRCGPTARPSNL